MDSHTEKNMSTVIHHGSTEGFLSTQSISGGLPLEKPLPTGVIQLPDYHHQMLLQHFAHLDFKDSSKNEKKLLEMAS